MMNFNSQVNAISILYFSYIVFFISSLFANSSSAVFLYVGNIVTLVTLIAFLLLKPKGLVLPKSVFIIFILCLTLGFVVIQPISKSHIYSVLIIFKILLVCLFVYQTKIRESSFLNFINITYIFYLTVSILFWLQLLPNPNFNAYLIKDEFLISLGSFKYYVLPGLEGSPANIDSYSAMVLLLNIFVKASQRYRYFVIVCAIVGVLLSFRLTAMIGVALLLFLTPLIKKKRWFIIFNLTGFLAFLLLLYALHVDQSLLILGAEVNLSTIAYLATHARSVIWEQQIVILFSEYEWFHYIFGGFNVELFNVPTYQVSGSETGRSQSNPHNTYLLMFFRSPVFMLLSLSLLILSMMTKMSEKYYVPISFILLACYTNSAIISLENPVFLYVIVFSILGMNNNKIRRLKVWSAVY